MTQALRVYVEKRLRLHWEQSGTIPIFEIELSG